jgi:hypothetical protein
LVSLSHTECPSEKEFYLISRHDRSAHIVHSCNISRCNFEISLKASQERTERKDIEFEYAHGRIFSYMCHGRLCFVEAFPIVYPQEAVHPLVSRSVLAGPHLLDMISIGNSVWEVHTNSGNYADENLLPAVQEHDRTRQHAVIRLHQAPSEHTGRKRAPSDAVAGIGD